MKRVYSLVRLLDRIRARKFGENQFNSLAQCENFFRTRLHVHSIQQARDRVGREGRIDRVSLREPVER